MDNHLIKCTRADGKTLWVNASGIEVIVDNPDGAKLIFMGGWNVFIKESAEEFVRAIKS